MDEEVIIGFMDESSPQTTANTRQILNVFGLLANLLSTKIQTR